VFLVHVECAHKNGDILGFEVIPVKGSRKDQHNIVTLGGDTGYMSAHVWCKEHGPAKSVPHHMHDVVEPRDDSSSMNALQLYVRNFKQADLTLTGTVRKANLATVATKTTAIAQPASQNKKRPPTPPGTGKTIGDLFPLAKRGTNGWDMGIDVDLHLLNHPTSEKACITCGTDVSPRWHPIDKNQEKILINGYAGTIGEETKKFIAQRHVQCHKCRKTNRQPVPHKPPPAEEPVEAPVTLRPPPVPTANGVSGSPHHASHAVSRMAGIGSGWGARTTPTAQPSVPLGQQPLLHGPVGGPPQPLSLTAPRTGPSPIAAPAPPPAPSHNVPGYAPPSTPFSDWPRPSPQPTAASHTIHHNHLRDLRPPPINSMSHHAVGPVQHGLGQPMVNGRPPSPRRGPATIHSNPPAYVSPWHASHNSHASHTSHTSHTSPHAPPPLHSLTNGGVRNSEHSFSQGLLSQRAPFSTTPHRSPSVSRDGIQINHESNANSNSAPPRTSDGRPANGASASPSLRNLLS